MAAPDAGSVIAWRCGLVVGKFSPLHRGHMLLIDAALAACREVIVISYSVPQLDGCAAAVRRHWLATLYPQVRVLVVDGEGVPSNAAPDHVHRLFVGQLCLDRLNARPDAVFTSENYGDGFAAVLSELFGAPVRHVNVDQARLRMPVSGTVIRADPHAHRAWLHPAVYASFVERIAILGGESSGKTTLAAGLALRLGSCWAPEFGREHWVARAGALRFDDLLHIAQVQVAREDALAGHAQRWLVCDTTPLATLFYSLDLFGRAEPELVQLAQRRYDSVLLCAPEFDFVQDGTRRDAAFRQRQHDWYRRVLDEGGIAYTVIAGTPPERVQRAANLLRTTPP